MCQKCTAPGPATGSVYLTISQTVFPQGEGWGVLYKLCVCVWEREREGKRGRVCAALCTHPCATCSSRYVATKCSSYSEGQLPYTHTHCSHTHTAHTHTTLTLTHRTACELFDRLLFCTLLLFVSMIWQQAFAWLKRKALPPWGYSMSHAAPICYHAPVPHNQARGNFWLCWLLDKLPTAAASAREQTVCPADTSVFALQWLSLLSCCPLSPTRSPSLFHSCVAVVVMSGIDKWCTISAPSLTCQ